MDNLDILAQKVADLIVKANKIVVFTGAGISTESGIPDFRGPDGVWKKFDPEEFTYGNFISSPENRRRHWKMLLEGGLAVNAEPNAAHLAIGELHRMGKLDCVVTQNVDNLHQRGGVPDSHVYELHGNMQWAICLRCAKRYPFAEVRARLEQGEETPDCPDCHGILKPDVVFFGESLPELCLEEASYRAATCDLLIVIGSSLVVYPAAWVPMRAVRANAKLVIINLSPTPLDEQAAVLIKAKAGEAMSRIMESVKKKLT
ncbi:MAG: hypothetical protein A2Z02_01650 [Chloroflexi bacterium RBG_16_48_7]|nr:MAG: hypothetical protein A2Z02_01650 [Chloroflexi bacterium RBG_16_48_7]